MAHPPSCVMNQIHSCKRSAVQLLTKIRRQTLQPSIIRRGGRYRPTVYSSLVERHQGTEVEDCVLLFGCFSSEAQPDSDVRFAYHQRSSEHYDMLSSNRNIDSRRRSRSPDRLSRRDRDERDYEGARYPRRSLDRDGDRGGDRHKNHERSRSPRPNRLRRHRSHSRSPRRSSKSPDSRRDKDRRKRGRSRSHSRSRSVSSDHSDSDDRRKHKHKKDKHKKRSRSRERKDRKKEKKVYFSLFYRSIFTLRCRKGRMQHLVRNGENMELLVILSTSSIP